MDHTVGLRGFPLPLTWQVAPATWSIDDRGSLSVTAGPLSDIFINPQGGSVVLNAPRLLGTVEGDFQLSARVRVEFVSTFDAGVLVVWVSESEWAKICLEYSPLHQPMVVSVVTHGKSDDANGFLVPSHEAWLRVSRLGPAFAFHASLDGKRWELIRHFPLQVGVAVSCGFLAQAPVGAGCTASFEDIRFSSQRLAEIRTGE